MDLEKRQSEMPDALRAGHDTRASAGHDTRASEGHDTRASAGHDTRASEGHDTRASEGHDQTVIPSERQRASGISLERPAGGGSIDADDDGLPVEIFAAKHHLPVPEVWRKVRSGELIGRTQWGRLIIYGSPEGAKAFAKGAQQHAEMRIPQAEDAAPAAFRHHIDPADLRDLPPLPPVHDPVSSAAANGSGGFLSLSGQRSESPEIALLLDHLSLAKEENREILRMTQESLRRVSELSDQVVDMKDAVISAKEEKIRALEEQLASRDVALAKLSEEKEDLETLARAVAVPPRPTRRHD